MHVFNNTSDQPQGDETNCNGYKRVTSIQFLQDQQHQQDETSNQLIDENNHITSPNHDNDDNTDNDEIENEYKSLQQLQLSMVHSVSTTSLASSLSSSLSSLSSSLSSSKNHPHKSNMLLFNTQKHKQSQSYTRIDSTNDLLSSITISRSIGTKRLTTQNNHHEHLTQDERRALCQLLKQQKQKEAEEELTKRAMKRSMTSNQEVWNAITMLPCFFYNIYVLLNNMTWLKPSDIQYALSTFDQWYSTFDSSMHCWTTTTTLLPNFYTFPPLTIFAINIACILHSPCSIYYHLLCAYKLPPGPKRMDHWSRRLDQAMIHMMSFMWAYGTSANTDYLLITIAFNIDCMYRLFQKGMKPKRTLYRMIAGFLIPVMPFIIRRDWFNVTLLMIIYSISGWLFSSYPFGGWSHGAFHLVCVLSNPIVIQSSLALPVDVVKDTVDIASKCVVVLTKKR